MISAQPRPRGEQKGWRGGGARPKGCWWAGVSQLCWGASCSPSFSSTQPTCRDSTSSVNELIKYARDTPGLRGRGALWEGLRGKCPGARVAALHGVSAMGLG